MSRIILTEMPGIPNTIIDFCVIAMQGLHYKRVYLIGNIKDLQHVVKAKRFPGLKSHFFTTSDFSCVYTFTIFGQLRSLHLHSSSDLLLYCNNNNLHSSWKGFLRDLCSARRALVRSGTDVRSG